MSSSIKRSSILMVAAENDALPKAKVGGIGDVVRDAPFGLARQGCTVNVVLPSYGYLHEHPKAIVHAHFPVFFGGLIEHMDLYLLDVDGEHDTAAVGSGSVRQWVLHHPLMSPCGVGKVYCDDGHDRPFAQDASKFALFCAGVAQAILNQHFGVLDILHLHDWHSSMLAILRRFDPRYSSLQSIKTVYTIHNLSLQGVRPFSGDASSLRSWFPSLEVDERLVCDPRVPHCVNPMRAGIMLSDVVHAVSPTYAREILRPSDVQRFIYGGEGLEDALMQADDEGRLVGILNGCDYPNQQSYARLSKARLLALFKNTLFAWMASSPVLSSAHWLAHERIKAWQDRKEKGIILSSVGRLTGQKVRLYSVLFKHKSTTATLLDHLLMALGNKGLFVVLGSGEPECEQMLLKAAGQHDNLVYLNGYSNHLSQALYNSGDVFIMPSSFEPCGISQMLAMRAGQPCVVHGVGGLNDTVIDEENGYVFRGDTGEEQARQCLSRVLLAIKHLSEDRKSYKAICDNAKRARFTWDKACSEYLEKLY